MITPQPVIIKKKKTPLPSTPTPISQKKDKKKKKKKKLNNKNWHSAQFDSPSSLYLRVGLNFNKRTKVKGPENSSQWLG